MSQGTNSERITQNNSIINDNNTDLDTIRTKMAEVFEPINLQSKDITITENGTTTIEPDEGYDGLSDVDVTVATSGVDINEIFTDTITKGTYQRQSLIGSSIKKVPSMIISPANSAEYLFADCINLEEIGELNTTEITSMQAMFLNCSKLKNFPELDMSSVTNTSEMFAGCKLLENIPSWVDVSKVTSAYSMFSGCVSLTSIPQLDFSRSSGNSNLFTNCTSLVNVPALSFGSNMFTENMFLNCPNLSIESLNNILYIFATYFNSSTYKTLKKQGLSQEQAELCTEMSNWELCVNKGWTTGY